MTLSGGQAARSAHDQHPRPSRPPSSPPPSGLPLRARGAATSTAPCAAFAPAAEVVDEGQTFRGTEEIRTFLARPARSSRSRPSSRRRARRRRALGRHHRLEGDFPGGIADLAYRFELADDLIVRLDIGA